MYSSIVNMDVNNVLMFADVQVMEFNIAKKRYSVINKKYLPYGMRGSVVNIDELTQSTDEIIQHTVNNHDVVCSWLADRILLLSRTNAKQIYNSLGFMQSDNRDNKLTIALTCRAVSVIDMYWVRREDENIKWEDVNLKCNPLNKIITDIALTGKHITFRGNYSSPELTTNGTFAKAWRQEDGELWLYKLGTTQDRRNESMVEVSVSNVLDKCSVDHIKYIAVQDNGMYAAKCACMSTDNLSIVPAYEYMQYCMRNGIDFYSSVKSVDADNFYKMLIVDYLICNPDRHGNNWGFYMNNNTMEVTMLHPLFDHNMAYDAEMSMNPDYVSEVTGRSSKVEAEDAVKHVDFYFTDEIVQNDFTTSSKYHIFMDRATKLGITRKDSGVSSFQSAIDKMTGN